MPRTPSSKGACAFCGRAMTRAGMAKHLQSCPARAEQNAAAAAEPRNPQPVIHLQVQPAQGGPHWLQLEMNGDAKLKRLDAYLRTIWLDCCGHLSEFTIGGPWSGRKVAMTRDARQVLKPGTELFHVYDFGTSSETLIRAVGVREGAPLTKHPIALLARNEPPSYPCMECDRDAAWLCMECIYEEERAGTLCEEHTASHPHDSYGEPLPIVNSPRVGMCGYEGPAEAPWQGRQ